MAAAIRLPARPDCLFAELSTEVGWDGPASAGPPCRNTKAAATPASVAAAAASGPNVLARDFGLA